MSSERKQMPLRLPAEIHDALKGYAYFAEMSMNDVVVRAVREFLATAGHDEQFEAMTRRARQEYRLTLDKLRDL